MKLALATYMPGATSAEKLASLAISIYEHRANFCLNLQSSIQVLTRFKF